MSRPAFYLFEFSLYQGMLILFSMLVFTFFWNFQQSGMLFTHKMERQISKTLTYDLILKDLDLASKKVEDWDLKNFVFSILKIKNNNLEQVNIGFKYDNWKLLRIAGKYDFQNKKWIESAKSVVCYCDKLSKFSILLSPCQKYVEKVVLSYE